VGDTGISGIVDKMAFDASGTLYVMTSTVPSMLYTIDTSTSTATSVGSVALTGHGGDIVFDDHGDLYAHVKGGKLLKINLADLSVTEIQDTDIASTGMVYKDGKFYATDNKKNLFSFTHTSGVTTVGTTNDINERVVR